VVLEDDYDAEFRYDRRPVASVQGMDAARVCLLGSLSKTLAPALGIGWIVPARRWSGAPELDLAAQPPAVDQLAFAEFLRSGAYDRHLRASRQRYRARRDALARALGARLPGCAVSGAAAGLHLLLRLPAGAAGAAVAAETARRDVRVMDLDVCRATPGPGPGAGALVLGYGNLADAAVEEAVARLASAVRSAGPDAATRTGR
jgi:GntR family transcriptional regulator/MocR family aminotransferase